jgi:multiple sugar transport system permease protein
MGGDILEDLKMVPDKNIVRKKVKFNKDALWGYIMIAPMMLGLSVICIGPFFQNFFYSFTKWNAFGRYKWIGFGNYKTLFKDPEVFRAIGNTFKYIILTLPIGLAISLIIAVLLNQKIKGIGIYRTLFFLPAVTMPAAIAMVWRWLYNGDYGLINFLLSKISIKGPFWISDPRYAIFSLAIVAIWGGIGYNMVIFLSGLQGISSTYYEAASIDGAGTVEQFLKITLPLLTPTIFFTTVMGLVSSFQVFDIIYMLIGKNSLAIDSTETIVYLFYKNAFLINNKGYASSIAIILFLIILIFTIIQLRMQKKWVHYE